MLCSTSLPGIVGIRVALFGGRKLLLWCFYSGGLARHSERMYTGGIKLVRVQIFLKYVFAEQK